MNGISYDVRIWGIEIYRGTKVTTYTVRWKVGLRRWRRSFRIAAQADSFRAELLAAARRGEAFATETGLPASGAARKLAVSWYDFTCGYVDMKWKPASAKYRRAIAQALAAALPAMVKPTAGKPSDPDIRHAVLGWGYNTRLRPEAPADAQAILTWLSRNTRPVSDLGHSPMPALSWRRLSLGSTAPAPPLPRPDATAPYCSTRCNTRSNSGCWTQTR